MCVQVILSVMDTSTTVQFMLPRIVHCWCHHQSPVLMLCRPVVSTVSTTETPYMPSGPSLEMMVWWRCRAAWFLHCITSSSWTESAWECIRWASLMCTGWISLSFYLGFNWYVIESGQGFILMMYDGVTKLHILFFFFFLLYFWSARAYYLLCLQHNVACYTWYILCRQGGQLEQFTGPVPGIIVNEVGNKAVVLASSELIWMLSHLTCTLFLASAFSCLIVFSIGVFFLLCQWWMQGLQEVDLLHRSNSDFWNWLN